MAAPVLQFKRGLLSALPGLRAGEPGFTTNTFDLYVGIDSTTNNNKFFGSHRYWTKETDTTGSGINLVERSDSGSNKITLKAPNTALASDTTYTLPATPDAGKYLTVDANGILSWGDANATGGTLTNTTLSGVTTISGNLFANANVTLGDASTDVITVKGTATFEQPITGTISTATRATRVDTTTATAGTYYPGLFSNSTGLASTTVYVDAGISYVSDTDTLTLTGDIAVNGGDLTSSATTFNLVNTNATAVNFAGAATALNLGATSGVTTVRNSLRVTNSLFDSANASGSGGQFLISTGVGIGWTTISGVSAGTISTTTRALTVDTVQSTNGASPHFLTFVDSDNVSPTAETIYTDSGISFIPSTNSLTISGDVAVNGGDVTTTATTATVFDTNATTVTAFGAGTAILLGAATGITTVRNNLTVASDVAVNGGDVTTTATTATVFDTNATTVTAFGAGTAVQLSAATGITTVRNNLTVGGDLRINGNDIQASDGAANILLTSNTLTTFSGDIRVNGNDIQASDGNNNITLTSNTLTAFAGDIRVNGNDIQSSTGATAITLAGTDVTIGGDVTVGGNDIRASNGTVALTLATTGAVTAAQNLTVQGDLIVQGSTTQVNSTALTVEDRTIDLGLVEGVIPASATTWDLGILFNYNSGGAKKSAVIWEHADSRFKFASVLGSDTNGTDANTPQLTVTTFAPIEISALYVNDCAGQSQVISCTGTTRSLENITIDAGSF